MGAWISPASLYDSDGGIELLKASREDWLFLERCIADSACAGPRVAGATAIAITVVRAEPGQQGFAAQPRRLAAERTFANVGRCRRLARDHDATSASAISFFVLASAMLLGKRLTREIRTGFINKSYGDLVNHGWLILANILLCAVKYNSSVGKIHPPDAVVLNRIACPCLCPCTRTRTAMFEIGGR